jgi:hypothetical protein
MIKGRSILFGLVLALFVTFSSQARANVITGANADVTCSGYNLMVTIILLDPNDVYELDYTFTLTPTGGSASQVMGDVMFQPPTFTDIVMAGGMWPSPPAPLVGEYTVTGTTVLTSDPQIVFPITFNGTTSTSALLECGGAGGCPATPGYWKTHPFPTSVKMSGLTIGGVTYTPAQLLTILNSTGSGDAVAIIGKQLVAALLNMIAGGIDNPQADAAVMDAENLISTNSINLLTSKVKTSSTLGQKLIADEVVLNSYNNGNSGPNGPTCSPEGSGLNLGM